MHLFLTAGYSKKKKNQKTPSHFFGSRAVGQYSRAAVAQSQGPDHLDPNPRHQISLGLSFLHMESEDNNRIMGLLGEFNELTHGKCRIRQWRLASQGKKGQKKKQIPTPRFLSRHCSNPLQRLSDKH